MKSICIQVHVWFHCDLPPDETYRNSKLIQYQIFVLIFSLNPLGSATVLIHTLSCTGYLYNPNIHQILVACVHLCKLYVYTYVQKHRESIKYMFSNISYRIFSQSILNVKHQTISPDYIICNIQNLSDIMSIIIFMESIIFFYIIQSIKHFKRLRGSGINSFDSWHTG